MNILVDELDTILESKIGKGVEFRTDFRTAILFEQLMTDRNYTIKQKIAQSIRLFYPNPSQIKDPQKAMYNIMWFYSCGKKDYEQEAKEQEEREKRSKTQNAKKPRKAKKQNQIYDYEYDDSYIYSAFMQQYGIDLQDIKYLHWWKFKAMFDSLNKDTKIVEIMGYRAVDLGKIKDKEEKSRLSNLKKIYKLPDMRTQEQKEADFGNAFW